MNMTMCDLNKAIPIDVAMFGLLQKASFGDLRHGIEQRMRCQYRVLMMRL